MGQWKRGGRGGTERFRPPTYSRRAEHAPTSRAGGRRGNEPRWLQSLSPRGSQHPALEGGGGRVHPRWGGRQTAEGRPRGRADARGHTRAACMRGGGGGDDKTRVRGRAGPRAFARVLWPARLRRGPGHPRHPARQAPARWWARPPALTPVAAPSTMTLFRTLSTTLGGGRSVTGAFPVGGGFRPVAPQTFVFELLSTQTFRSLPSPPAPP